MRRAQGGFTLVELMIVVAILAIVASIAAPNLFASRSVANEQTVVTVLRTITTAEFEFKTRAVVDTDRDGNGEYGRLGEMAGEVPLRGTALPLRPSLVSSSLGGIDGDGHATRNGFLFALYLPSAGGAGLAETAANEPAIDARMAADYWTCVAWPSSRTSGQRTVFFVNQQGTILKCSSSTYDGKSTVPPAGAALVGIPPARIDTHELAVNRVGADGNLWLPVN
jgi:prepilin-type N-terminal cleavage/methylation domain-containing protein